MTRRQLAVDDLDDVNDTLVDLWKRSPAKKMKYVDKVRALNYVHNAVRQGGVYVIHGCLVMVSEGSDWYSAHTFLFEELVIAFEEGYDASKVPDELIAIAKARGCCAVISGDTQIGAMSKHYLSAGYTSLGQQFHRSVP